MAYPFNHKEFVAMMDQYNLKSNSITIPEHTILNDLVTDNQDCVYLLKSGLLAGYIDFDNDKIYSIFTANFFMGYYTIFENTPLLFTYQTLTECEVIIYKKKDIEYSLSLFPENFGFQYTIMRTIAKHGYYKSLIQYRDKKDQLAFVFEMLVKLLDIEVENGVASLPKAISTTVIKNYCTLSKAFFYSQLKELKEAGIISKVKLQWCVNMDALLEKNNAVD
ncbi:Crp/Fnr family transcriptional regulator [Listeria cossartiae subsp. cayugensis]|uniref:Crp/Fnr family transcriptional regulator n=1 Tax=Listeria cossartiae subsp. cayugensis TaxID=2713505 RepID=A0ABU2ING6_9LIST|nr:MULTISPECIES: Crp/Fnr family transcriptional regulator [Listeria]MDT0001759.1 Crp/Fnr family transcriptional regulator [Listeria cossartiae subsp. cayugensis]MDT0001980.1 Crp/Fnr family transcriptional regulator [Listeria cossartiae subsp. cayugensis]MDT0009958.1 Crp/Fnr family transcriptional regulator [Listeria cossartiae subsp. cayugensis]MDT0014206.1 Crp/Fnr family transcriptional regulator [Listeria cossartiae subsp. cayugensis]MDT0019651.1 Crp/Fnr family transcriptional regulator [Lis